MNKELIKLMGISEQGSKWGWGSLSSSSSQIELMKDNHSHPTTEQRSNPNPTTYGGDIPHNKKIENLFNAISDCNKVYERLERLNTKN